MLKSVLNLNFHTDKENGYLEISNEVLLAYVSHNVRSKISSKSRKDSRFVYLHEEKDAPNILAELRKSCEVKITKKEYPDTVFCHSFKKAV